MYVCMQTRCRPRAATRPANVMIRVLPNDRRATDRTVDRPHSVAQIRWDNSAKYHRNQISVVRASNRYSFESWQFRL